MSAAKFPLSKSAQTQVRRKLLEDLRRAMKQAGFAVTCFAGVTATTAWVKVSCPRGYQEIDVSAARAEAQRVVDPLLAEGALESAEVTAIPAT